MTLRPTFLICAAAALLATACDSPPAQQPQESGLVNATRTDQAYPSGAGGNEITTGSSAAPGGNTLDGNAASGNVTGAGASGAGQSGDQGMTTQTNSQ